MSCIYIVNGQEVSENQLKEILNNGLLDTLVSKGSLVLDGFKTDTDRLKAKETFRKIVDTIPAKNLRDILLQEISSREGYPLNMAAYLELDETGENFKIPIWASSYSSKFENILTSLITNGVIKQKFNGNSYVLGSPEGVKVKPNMETGPTDWAKSGVVFSEKFDPEQSELLPHRWDPETKQMLPAQIIIPFKFRDNLGNLLSAKDFCKIDPVTKKMIIDFDKIPEKILKGFGFRIPTQGHNSMSAVEIVGFLPKECGDLMFAPRDFTKQMGSDFDVDKLYHYAYNTFYQDGKLHTNFLSSKEKIDAQVKGIKEKLNELKDSLKLTKEERINLDKYIKSSEDNLEDLSVSVPAKELLQKVLDPDTIKKIAHNIEDIHNLVGLLAVLKKSYIAARQNNILDIHMDIMLSNNPNIIKSIKSLDSFGEFKEYAKEIENLKDSVEFSFILSDEYQKTKYIEATAGKTGVSTFSLDSTLNAVLQGKDIVLFNLNKNSKLPENYTKEDILTANDPLCTIGEYESKGDISSIYTLKSQELINNNGGKITPEIAKKLKKKSEVIRYLQSSAVDNAKEAILEKLNLNDKTFDAVRALAILGFEEGDIAFLLSQEIILEFVSKSKELNSSLRTYTANGKELLIEELRAKYDPSNRISKEDPAILEDLKNASIDKLRFALSKKLQSGKDIEKDTPDHNLQQILLLEKFLELESIGKTLKGIQSSINSYSKGVPKSLLETTQKVEQIEKLETLAYNAEKLLENSLAGFAADTVKFANKIYTNFFPYNSSGFNKIVGEIINVKRRGSELSASKLSEMQQEIFENIKAYFFSSNNTELVSGDVNEERARLFIDIPGKNLSLASIVKTLSEEKWVMENNFLNKLTTETNKNGAISRLNFDAASGENFDESQIYLGFIDLVNSDKVIGTFNNVEYTKHMLAQDLIAAAFLEGGQQKAKQYMRYIPASFLKNIDFSKYLSSKSFDYVDDFGGLTEPDPRFASRFGRQYFQNNPSEAASIDTTQMLLNPKENTKGLPDKFMLNKEGLLNYTHTEIVNKEEVLVYTKFVTVYDASNKEKYTLYEFNYSTREYEKLEILTDKYEFKQYNAEGTPVSIVTGKKAIPTKQPIPQTIVPETIISENPTAEINQTKTVLELGINFGLSNKEALNDLFNSLSTSEEVSEPIQILLEKLQESPLNSKIPFKYINKEKGGKGQFTTADNKETGEVLLNLHYLKDMKQNEIAELFAHEMIHANTSISIRQYLVEQEKRKENPSYRDSELTDEQRYSIAKLETLFNKYRDHIVKSGKVEQLNAFIKAYNSWKESGDIDDFNGLNTDEAKAEFYGAIKLAEFVTMALTDSKFQTILNDIEYEGGVPFWSKFVDALVNLLSSLGIDIKENSLLKAAVEESLVLIDVNQKSNKNNLSESTTEAKSIESRLKVSQPTTNTKSGVEEIYSQLGNETKFENVVIDEVNGRKPSNNKNTIVAYRTRDNNFLEALEQDNAIGNPWGPYSIYKTSEDGTAVKEFIAWMTGEKYTDKLQDYRQAIINKIPEMKGKTILYYKDLGRPSHATALDYLINKYNWRTQTNIKPGVEELFNDNPNLASVGTPEQYSQYLDTVFPDSKVKDIVYHNSPNKFEKFDNLKIGSTTSGIGSEDRFLGIFFTSDKKAYEGFNIKGFQYPSILNLKNPINGGINYNNLPDLKTEEDFKNYQKQLIKDNYDGVEYGKSFMDMGEGGFELPILEAIVFEPEQIHILGSNQDIEGFKEFVSKENNIESANSNFTENIKSFVNSIIPNWLNNKQNELSLAAEFNSLQLLSEDGSTLKDRIDFGKEAEKLIKEGLRGKNPFGEVAFESQIPNMLYTIISGKLAQDGISESDMYNNIFLNTKTRDNSNDLMSINDLFDESIPTIKSDLSQQLEDFLLICKK